MKRTLKSVAVFAVLSVLSLIPVLSSAGAASAQVARGMSGNYVGAGIAAGVTSSGDADSAFGANVQGRYAVPGAPISLRGAALFSNDTAALMPIVSYDIAVAPNTNVYLGAGYSFVTNNDRVSPLGTENAPVLTAGVETAVNRNVAIYGDAKLGIDAYRNSSDPAVSLQLGAAYRF